MAAPSRTKNVFIRCLTMSLSSPSIGTDRAKRRTAWGLLLRRRRSEWITPPRLHAPPALFFLPYDPVPSVTVRCARIAWRRICVAGEGRYGGDDNDRGNHVRRCLGITGEMVSGAGI